MSDRKRDLLLLALGLLGIISGLGSAVRFYEAYRWDKCVERRQPVCWYGELRVEMTYVQEEELYGQDPIG